MLTGKANRPAVIDLYNAALAKLYGDFASERVVKAILLLAKSLYDVDREQGQEAIKSFA